MSLSATTMSDQLEYVQSYKNSYLSDSLASVFYVKKSQKVNREWGYIQKRSRRFRKEII